MENNKGKIFKKGSKQSGITLVALVVTVVVLLILAGVSIRLVLDNNGIITKAGEAKDKHEQGRVNDQTDLSSAEEWINQMTGGNSGGGSLPTNADGSSKPYLPSSDFTQVSGTDLSNGLVIEDGSGNQYVWIEVPKTAAVYPTAGTAITEFTDDEYTAIETDLHTYTNDYRDGTSYKDEYYSEATTGLTSEAYSALKKKMLKSVYQNGGFWIGRYEIGIDENTTRSFGSDYSTEHPTTDQTPVIKANKVPYNWIRCSQAESLAETFAPSGYTSSLMFGVQWNLVLKYLETKGASQADLKTDSTSWGNYYNATDFTITNTNAKYSTDKGASWISVSTEGYSKPSSAVLLTTGADVRNSEMNIYDLAGNVYEWTLEYTSLSSHPCAIRGGSYIDYGSDSPASYREISSTTHSNLDIGARVSLY